MFISIHLINGVYYLDYTYNSSNLSPINHDLAYYLIHDYKLIEMPLKGNIVYRTKYHLDKVLTMNARSDRFFKACILAKSKEFSELSESLIELINRRTEIEDSNKAILTALKL